MLLIGQKYGVTERALWSDWLRRDKWVPVAAGFDYFTTMNGIQIFRKPKMFEKYRY